MGIYYLLPLSVLLLKELITTTPLPRKVKRWGKKGEG
jgi:hypothetical protein